jgi:hypothetical protein
MNPKNGILLGIWLIISSFYLLIKGYQLYFLNKKKFVFPIAWGIGLNRLINGKSAADRFEQEKRRTFNFKRTGLSYLLIGIILLGAGLFIIVNEL